jgi:threonine-phosphate decarboxylase
MSINHGANLFDISKKLGFEKQELMDFSSNINPFGASSKAKDALIKNIDMVSIYPDPNYKNLKKSISNYCSCNDTNILLGSGATELISSFINIINPSNALLLSPAYSEYERELKKINCNISKYFHKKENDFKVDVDHLIENIKINNYELIIICNPNNPTGFAFSKEEMKKILESTNAFVMVDETYIEFTDMNMYSSTPLVDECTNLFVIRGTSKFFSTPGIRLGYGLISNKKVYEKIEQRLDLWNINIFATIMGEIMFKDKNYIEENINKIKNERDYLTKELKSIEDLKVFESKGNFILCEIKSKKLNSKELYEKLIENKIVIRNATSFEGLDEYFFRVCTLKPEENKLLIKKLRDVFAS